MALSGFLLGSGGAAAAQPPSLPKVATVTAEPTQKRPVSFANDVMPDKFVYASAFPFRPLSDLTRYQQLPFKPGVLEQILWHNPARLLKLS